jgi:hypothetical protein
MGAQFTRIYAQHHGLVIVPKKHATLVSETRKEENAPAKPQGSSAPGRKDVSSPRGASNSTLHQV